MEAHRRHAPWLWATVIGLLAAIYVFIAANTPLILMVWQAFDDGLFVRIGRALAEGRWLGTYDDLTLAKGPGYPAFLAANYWAGIPVTIAHAALYCASLAALAWVVLRKSGSYLLATTFFVLPLFHPKILEPARVIRDSIYMSQMVLVVAAVACSLYVATGRRQRIVSSVVAGLLLGWFWLTREESVGILPGLVVMVFFAWLHGRRTGETGWKQATLIVAGVFLATQLLFSFANLLVYGKFVGVEFKERNFQRAMSAMEGVESGKPISFVAVPRATRMQLYAVSPTFASLKPLLDPPGARSPAESAGCSRRPTACGDIGNGFFMWVVRRAAGKAGYFDSPDSASKFFERVTEDILRACEDGRLRCKRDLLPMIPPLTEEQWARIPVSVRQAFAFLRDPGTFPGPAKDVIYGPEDEFAATLSFLNWPQHYPKGSRPPVGLHLAGWYYAGSDAWFQVELVDDGGVAMPVDVVRRESPDLARIMQGADRQRFRISGRCGTACRIRFKAEDGTVLEIPVTKDDRPAPGIRRFGQGKLAFDPGSAVQFDTTLDDEVRFRVAQRVRAALYSLYRVIMPALLAAGFVAWLVAVALSLRKRVGSFALALASAAWVLVASRVAILILVDVSSFQAIHPPYLLPALTMSIIAAIASLWACRLAWNRT